MHAAAWLLFFLLPPLLRPPYANHRSPVYSVGVYHGRPPQGGPWDTSGGPAHGGDRGPAYGGDRGPGNGGIAPAGPDDRSGPSARPNDTPGRYDASAHSQDGPDDAFGWFNFFTDLWLILVFYFNTQVLVPAFVYKKRYWAFALSHLVIISGIVTFNYLLFTLFVRDGFAVWHMPVIFILFPYLIVTAAGMVYRLFRDKLQEEQTRQEKENENLKTELSLLRLQVSPHFMFNVLNNMVSLARKQSAQLEPSLIKLSSLMRYMLYEAEGKVLLDKEIDYLQSYIDLQRQRFEGILRVEVAVGEYDALLYIEPMLLIPFVENAFKHGQDISGEGLIRIEWHTLDGVLYFRVRNKFHEDEAEVKDKTSGIGLANVRRRLNLLYKGQHTLTIVKDNMGWFDVFLEIKLS